ncbi:MAG: UvrB/UvrC motif-containing protein [Candidatus Omnitrophota bacterium]|nr:UvrB/UvrC motif-containing protein [Candidatus Omnitrophota bacterium]
MVCNICGKNQATVHLTEIIDEQITELHLCEECAQKKGAQMESHFGLSDLLAGLADLGTQFNSPKTKTETSKLKCPKCGLTYEDFKKVGRLGCGECYNAFREALVPLLKRIHGSTQHYGKSPKKMAKVVKAKNDLQELKDRLQKAIQKEDFEEAAKLRDKIKEQEKKNNK